MDGSFARAREGDASATRAVVAALHPRLSKMAVYYARCSGEDAEDLLQEAWVGLLEALPHVDLSIGSPDQYLVQQARWRLLDAIRHARRRRCLSLEEAGPEPDLPAPDETPHQALCAREFARRLKPVQRAVLGHLLAGHTWRETGAALGCTSANIAYHVRRIRHQYTEWLEEK